jgi:hypothetical protein
MKHITGLLQAGAVDTINLDYFKNGLLRCGKGSKLGSIGTFDRAGAVGTIRAHMGGCWRLPSATGPLCGGRYDSDARLGRISQAEALRCGTVGWQLGAFARETSLSPCGSGGWQV